MPTLESPSAVPAPAPPAPPARAVSASKVPPLNISRVHGTPAPLGEGRVLSVQVKSANGHWEPAGPAGTCTSWGQSACADGCPMSSPRAVMSPRISQNAHDLPAASPTMSSPRTRRVLSVTPLDVTETGNWGQVMTPGGQYAQNQPTCTDESPPCICLRPGVPGQRCRLGQGESCR